MSDIPPPQPPPIPTAPQSAQGDSTGGVIPYKNPHALIAYYCGLFSIIPGLGLILGAVAFPLGISGLKKRKQNPAVRGALHAWIGIIGGGFSVLIHLAVIALIVMANANRR